MNQPKAIRHQRHMSKARTAPSGHGSRRGRPPSVFVGEETIRALERAEAAEGDLALTKREVEQLRAQVTALVQTLRVIHKLTAHYVSKAEGNGASTRSPLEIGGHHRTPRRRPGATADA